MCRGDVYRADVLYIFTSEDVLCGAKVLADYSICNVTCHLQLALISCIFYVIITRKSMPVLKVWMYLSVNTDLTLRMVAG